MPNTTTNYGLKKPYYSENADIYVLNENWDAVDEALTPTISQNTAPTSASLKGTLATVIGWIVNRIKAITGKTNWWGTPSATLEDCYNHIQNGTHTSASQSMNGFMSYLDKQKLDNAASGNIAGRIMIRDAYGRAQVQAPATSNDIANKAYVDDNFVAKNTATIMSTMLTAQSNTSYTTKQVRNIVIWTSGDTPPASGYGDLIVKIF